MAETTEYTFSAYLGPEFQEKLMWQLLVEPEFAEKVIPKLAIEYFDNPYLKRLFIIILEYFKENNKVPNYQNQSINHAISKYKSPNNSVEEEELFSLIKRIGLWNERIINKQQVYDGDVIQRETNSFIKQQEYRKLGEYILVCTKNGEIKNKNTANIIDEKFRNIANIGEEEDDSEEVIENVERALQKEFRKTIPTGVNVIDAVTGGGLGRGEIGLILTPSGIGKTSLLTKFANTAYEQEYNVAQIVFEDTKDQIKRKHYTIWSDIPLSKIDENNELVKSIVYEKINSVKGKGKLIIKRFSQENTTIPDIRNWMIGYQKKWGFKFDIMILDYLDCLESHKRTPDRNEAELAIVKGFETLAADLDIPAWSALQSNRSGFNAEFLEPHQTGGNIKRLQKSHFFMSVAKTPEQKEANLANIRIIKARFAQDGQSFTDCTFDNDRMKFIIEDSKYRGVKETKNIKHNDNDEELNKLEESLKEKTLLEKSSDIDMHAHINDFLNKKDNNIENNNTEINNIENKNIETIITENNNNTEIITTVDNDIETTITETNNIETIIIEKDKTEINSNNDELLEIDETKNIDFIETENTIIIENKFIEINNTEIININDNKIELLDFTGETTNKIIKQQEIKANIDDISPPKENISIETSSNRIYNIINSKKLQHADINIQEIEKKLILSIDEPQNKDGEIHNILLNLRKNQHVIKKE